VDIGLLLMSFGVGLLIGLTSMGGAALMAPFLILVLGVKPTVAVQTDLIYGAVTKVVAAGVHWGQNTVDVKVALRMAIGSVPGGLLGSATIYLLPSFGFDAEQYTKRAIGMALVVVAFVLLWRLFKGGQTLKPGPHIHWLQHSGTIIWGALVGFVVGLTSVGSGSLIAPFLLLVFPFTAAQAVGTDVLHAAILVGVTGMAHAFAGPPEWTMIATLLTGSIPGSIIGSRLVRWVPGRALRGGMAVLLLATGVKMV
jgi:hypothetical protein